MARLSSTSTLHCVDDRQPFCAAFESERYFSPALYMTESVQGVRYCQLKESTGHAIAVS